MHVVRRPQGRLMDFHGTKRACVWADGYKLHPPRFIDGGSGITASRSVNYMPKLKGLN
jgi:hypothetical protein